MEKVMIFLKACLLSVIAAIVSDFLILIILFLIKNYFQYGNPLTIYDFIGISIGSFLPLFALFTFLFWIGLNYIDKLLNYIDKIDKLRKAMGGD